MATTERDMDTVDNTRVKFAEKDSEDKDIGEGEIIEDNGGCSGVRSNGVASRLEASGVQAETSSLGSLEGVRGASLHGDTDSEDDLLDEEPEGTYARIIVIGVDGSAEAYHSFHWYISNMHVDGNFVILVHAFELPLLHSFQEMYVSPQMWSSTLKREARATTNMEKRLKGVLNRCRIPGKFLARGGRPGEVLVKVAEEEDADLIVVGTKGHSKLHRVIMGSVSSYVSKNAPCSVTICRHKGRGRRDSGGSYTSTGSGKRRRTASASSAGSQVRFSLRSNSDKPKPRERPRHSSTSSAPGIPGEQQQKSLFRGLISRKRNQSMSAELESQVTSERKPKDSSEKSLPPSASSSNADAK